MTLNDFTDIHTHNLSAPESAIINLPLGADVPASGYFSVGIHPWDTADTAPEHLEWVERMAAHPCVVAIGECGLDALRGASLQRQEEVFRQHVLISERFGKPLIIHAVRTLADILRLRRELHPSQQWVIHGFRGRPATARQLIAQGIDVSIGAKHHPDMPDGIDPAHIYHETD